MEVFLKRRNQELCGNDVYLVGYTSFLSPVYSDLDSGQWLTVSCFDKDVELPPVDEI